MLTNQSRICWMKNGLSPNWPTPHSGKLMSLRCRAAKVAMPFQAERRLQIEIPPAFFRRAFQFEIVDEADVIDEIVARISEVRRHLPADPIPTPVEFEFARGRLKISTTRRNAAM